MVRFKQGNERTEAVKGLVDELVRERRLLLVCGRLWKLTEEIV